MCSPYSYPWNVDTSQKWHFFLRNSCQKRHFFLEKYNFHHFGVWEALFETLEGALFCEEIVGWFGEVIVGRFGCEMSFLDESPSQTLRNLRSLCRRAAFTSWQFLPSLVPRSSSRVLWGTHPKPPSPVGLFPWTNEPEQPVWVVLFFTLLMIFKMILDSNLLWVIKSHDSLLLPYLFRPGFIPVWVLKSSWYLVTVPDLKWPSFHTGVGQSPFFIESQLCVWNLTFVRKNTFFDDILHAFA